jgi:hypothetical protein
MSESARPIVNETPVSAVTQGDPADTVEVKTVSGPVEVPRPTAPRDGTITGEPVYSDLHCPMLQEGPGDDRTIVEQHTDAEGRPAGKTVHRYPEQLVQTPAECPTCGKIVERHMLVHTALGTRDCAVALNAKARGEDPQAIIAAKAEKRAAAIATATEVPAGENLSPEAQAHAEWVAAGKPADAVPEILKGEVVEPPSSAPVSDVVIPETDATETTED